MEKYYYVYILASTKDGALYIGVTSNLIKRTYEHRNDTAASHASKYQIRRLIYFEQHQDINEAIKREKQMKAWKRQWKIELIEKSNPEWKDLYDEIAVWA